MEEIKKFWNSLDGVFIVRKRELFLGGALCAMTGLSLGLLLSPRKTVVVEAEPEKIEKKKHHLTGKHRE